MEHFSEVSSVHLLADEAPLKSEQKSHKKLWIIIAVIASLTIIATVIVLVVILGQPSKQDSPIDPQEVTKDLEFIYINDAHLDYAYKNDSKADKVNLCRKSTGESILRPYGQYGCDAPYSIYESLIKFIKTASPNPDFILCGGDVIAHGLNPTAEKVVEVSEYFISKLQSVYPNVPIYITLGNNDYVVNYGSFNTDKSDFQNMLKPYGKFMTKEQKATFTKGGYYAVDIHGNGRLLLLNTVLYKSGRPGTPESWDDPYGQFEWIEKEAEKAIKEGKEIGLAMHIPPSISYFTLTNGWSNNYVERFNKLIEKYDFAYMLCGHLHVDTIMNNYKQKLSYVLSAPSISPQHNNNPAFRVYRGSDGLIKDYEQYYADLLWNKPLEWGLEYRFSDYGANMTMDGIGRAVSWIRNTGEGRWRYREHVYARADEQNKVYLCSINATTTEEANKCLSMLNGRGILPYEDLDD